MPGEQGISLKALRTYRPYSGSSGSSYPTLDQLTAGVLTGGWPNLYGYPMAAQSGFPTAAQRGEYGVYQPGPNIGMLPQIPLVSSAPLISTGVIPSLLPLSSIPTYSRPPPPIPQSTVSLSVPSTTVVSQAVRTSAQPAGPIQSGPTLPGPTPTGLSQAGPTQTQLSTAADQHRNSSNGGGRGGRNRSGSNRNANRNRKDGLTGFQRQYPSFRPYTSSGPTHQPNVSVRPFLPHVTPAVTSGAGLPRVKTESADDQISALRKQNEEMRRTMQEFVNQVQGVRDQIAEAIERDECDSEEEKSLRQSLE